MNNPATALPIRVLLLEDRAEDVELMLQELRRSGFAPAWERLETEAEYLARLQSPLDVILADYRVPQLEAPRALELLQDLDIDIPFIVVSGAIGEDLAVAIMRQGATDYLLKDRLMRLGPAVRRALAEKQVRDDKHRAERALHASDTRFYSFMNNNPALAFIKDPDGRVLYINNTCERAWDTTLSECQGKLDHELWPAADAARMRALDLSVLERGEPSHVVEELPSRQPVRHLLTYRFPFADATGCRLLGGVSVDITERTQTERALAAALAAKEVLLQEVHHRVKNNLQIISSLLNMQAELLTDPSLKEALLESRHRVESMAMIHERLYITDDIDQLDLRQYVEALARELFNAYAANSSPVRLRLELEPVSLELSQAIPCGLILNELVSNCLKYAFPNQRPGELLIALRCSDDNRVTMRVADNGIGLPPGLDWQKSKTLGLRIVNILARQLMGTVLQESAAGGDFSLTFCKAASRSPVHPPARAASRNAGK
jgi:two-component sensor histidine kinase/PAS domain-containing protein